MDDDETMSTPPPLQPLLLSSRCSRLLSLVDSDTRPARLVERRAACSDGTEVISGLRRVTVYCGLFEMRLDCTVYKIVNQTQFRTTNNAYAIDYSEVTLPPPPLASAAAGAPFFAHRRASHMPAHPRQPEFFVCTIKVITCLRDSTQLN